MAGIVKKKLVDSSSTGQANTTRQLVAPRQRGIPTRVSRDGDRRQLDGNRNLRPPSRRIQLSSSESLENKDHNSNAKLDNADAMQTGCVLLRSVNSLSSPTVSDRKTNPVTVISECDNHRSQAISCGSAFVSDQDVSKPVNRGGGVKTSLLSAYNPAKLRPVAKLNIEQSSPVRAVHVTESSHNSFKSPKRFTGNRNSFNRNKSKVSSSDETCTLKSAEELLCLNGALGKEISVSADHIAVRDGHSNSLTTVGLLNANEVFASDSSVISEPAVTGSCLKEISPEKANERSLERAAETKRIVRGRPGTENHGNRSNLRPQSSGGLTSLRKNPQFRQSASNERTTSSMPRNTNSQPASNSGGVNSSETELDGTRRRKGSGGASGIKVSSWKDMGGKSEGPSSPKFHAVAKNQNAVAFGAASKSDKGLKNHVNMTVSGLYRNVVVPSRKAELRGREASAKLSSVPKILVSPEAHDLETVPVSSLPASSGYQEKNEVTACKSSPVFSSMVEAPPARDMICPSDNRQAQPMVQTMDGEDSDSIHPVAPVINQRKMLAEEPYVRLFRSRPRTANTDEHQKMGGYVEMADVQSNSWNHRTDERRNTSESENVVVMDGETYQQMKTEFKALEATILQLQHVLIEGDKVESQIGDNCWKSASKARCCDGGNEETPIDGQNHLAHLCQENIRLQDKVDKLEKLLQEQEQMISILKQKSAPYDIRMLPEIESATSEADMELCLNNNCCATEHNVEVPASSLPSRLTVTDELQSNGHLSTTVASPPNSPQRVRFLHTTPVQHFSEKSEECHTPTGIKAFGNSDCKMRYLCNVEHVLQDDDDGDVTLTNTESAELSQVLETSQSKRPRKTTLNRYEDEEFSGDYSMFDYNFSVDSDNELGPAICDAPASISLGVAGSGQGGMPFVSAEHCISGRRLLSEENGNHTSIASDSRPGTGDAASCGDARIINADTSDNDVEGSAQSDQNVNGCLDENSLCDHLGKFDESFSSHSSLSAGCAGEERNIYNRQRISKDDEDSSFNLPVRFDRHTAELWSRGDLKSNEALITQVPKCETSSIPSVLCNSVSDKMKSPKPGQTSQSSNVTLSKIPNQSRTLLRMPKSNVSINHRVEHHASGSSVTSAPPSSVSSSSEAVNVVPEAKNPNKKQLKEPPTSRLPSLRFSRVPKLPTSVSK